ncbi:class I SAM-dependent methyltransferase [Methanobacterium sp. MBAC-LM]|uniref:class I SAM-dependent methyltransferase n=1 Tax=Methanobacterium sp. MBAC-LM TaxID=3412034 RepID=UPI003C728855
MVSDKNSKIWFLGRSYDEYIKMFSLNKEELKNIRILDCAAGASSFTSHLLRKGYDIKAVDILYNKNPEEIKKQCQNDFNTLLDVHSGLDNKVNWKFFKNPENMIEQRIKVYKEFITDYSLYKGIKYIEGHLPSLPFNDNYFDLVLSSHLLFLYQDRLGYDFHRKSIEEMLRISSDEIRIYPIVKLRGEGSKSEFLSRIIKELCNLANFEIVKVDYKFRRGGDEMLKITKT